MNTLLADCFHLAGAIFRSCRWPLLLALAASLIGVPRAAAQSDDVEYKLKAAFVLNFARYVEWPESAFSSPTSAIVIGVLGRDPFGKDIDATMEGKAIDKRPVQVKRGRDVSDLMDCHVIFVSSSERDKLPGIFSRLRGQPILTVGDMEGFTTAGGMINLKKKQGTLRFDINRAAAEEAKLRISSKLLKLRDNDER